MTIRISTVVSGGNRHRCAGVLSLFLLSAFGPACGSPPPPPPKPVTSTPAIAVDKEKPVDISPVPDPPGLVVVGRIAKPDAILASAGVWTHLPIPSGQELVRSIADDSVAEVVDISSPIDGAVAIGLSRHGIDPLMAFSVSVKSFDQAKAKLGGAHRLMPADNGSFKVLGIGKTHSPPRIPPPDGRGGGPIDDKGDDDDDDSGVACVLAHATQGARLVCGESAALEALVPYMSRTMPRQTWTSDVHVEFRPEPVRAPLSELRSSLPILARSMLGTQSPAVREFIDAGLGEMMDVVNDAQKLQVDAQVNDGGLVFTSRFDFQSNKSTIARILTNTDKADSTPAAFWHLPGDTDTAFFGRGSDPKLWEHPREMLTNLLLEATDGVQMPDAEKKAVKDLIADRMLSLLTDGGFIYAKGFDQAALEKVISSRANIKRDDEGGQDETKRLIFEQVVGWHLFQVQKPVAEVGPVLKDWSTLWNRPTFTKWASTIKTSGSPLPKMRVAPMPAGVTMPKDTVHLEVTILREDLVEPPVWAPPPPPPPPAPGGAKRPPPPPSAPMKTPALRKIPRKPIVFHVFAVPDGGATWLAFGLDAKLVAQKAAASVASAPDTNSLGKVGKGNEGLREGKLNGGGLMTIRGIAVITAFDQNDRSPFSLLSTLPTKGATPIILTGRAEPPSANAKGGTATGSINITRAVIEDMVKLAMTSH